MVRVVCWLGVVCSGGVLSCLCVKLACPQSSLYAVRPPRLVSLENLALLLMSFAVLLLLLSFTAPHHRAGATSGRNERAQRAGATSGRATSDERPRAATLSKM